MGVSAGCGVDVSVRCDVGVSAGVWCGCVCRGVVWVCLQGCGVGVGVSARMCLQGVVFASAGVWCVCSIYPYLPTDPHH